MDQPSSSNLEESLWQARMDRMDVMIRAAMMRRHAYKATGTVSGEDRDEGGRVDGGSLDQGLKSGVTFSGVREAVEDVFRGMPDTDEVVFKPSMDLQPSQETIRPDFREQMEENVAVPVVNVMEEPGQRLAPRQREPHVALLGARLSLGQTLDGDVGLGADSGGMNVERAEGNVPILPIRRRQSTEPTPLELFHAMARRREASMGGHLFGIDTEDAPGEQPVVSRRVGSEADLDRRPAPLAPRGLTLPETSRDVPQAGAARRFIEGLTGNRGPGSGGVRRDEAPQGAIVSTVMVPVPMVEVRQVATEQEPGVQPAEVHPEVRLTPQFHEEGQSGAFARLLDKSKRFHKGVAGTEEEAAWVEETATPSRVVRAVPAAVFPWRIPTTVQEHRWADMPAESGEKTQGRGDSEGSGEGFSQSELKVFSSIQKVVPELDAMPGAEVAPIASGAAVSVVAAGVKPELEIPDPLRVEETALGENARDDSVMDPPVVAKLKAASEVELKAELKAEPGVELEAASEVELKVEPVVELKAASEVELKAELKAEPEVELEAASEVELKVEPVVELKAASEVELKAASEVELKAEPEVEPEVELEAASEVELEAEPEAEPEVELEAASGVELKAEPVVELEAKSDVESEAQPFVHSGVKGGSDPEPLASGSSGSVGSGMAGMNVPEQGSETFRSWSECLDDEVLMEGLLDRVDSEPTKMVLSRVPSRSGARSRRFDQWHFALLSVFEWLNRLSGKVMHTYIDLISQGAMRWSHYYTKRGNRFFQQGMIHDAVFCYRKALEKDGGNVEVLSGLGRCYLKLGACDRALGFLENARQRDETGGTWLDDDLIVAYIGSGRHGWAEGWIRKQLARAPNDPGYRSTLWFRLAEVLGHLGRHEESVLAYKEAVVLDPEHAQHLRALSSVLRLAGQETATSHHSYVDAGQRSGDHPVIKETRHEISPLSQL